MSNPKPNLTQAESDFHSHMTRWGSDGYPAQKRGRKWFWVECHGVSGSPTAYQTKREAVVEIEAYLAMLDDKLAGRLS